MQALALQMQWPIKITHCYLAVLKKEGITCGGNKRALTFWQTTLQHARATGMTRTAGSSKLRG